MSATSSSASTTSSSSGPLFTGGNQNTGSGVSSSLYLFTFLIVILVLAAISALLLFRAYYIRRRFQTRVEEAIRNNQPLPPDAARALGLVIPGTGRNGKKEKRLGPMPGMWEAEMRLKDGLGEEKGEWGGEVRGEGEAGGGGKWGEFMPVAVVHFPSNQTPEPVHPAFIIPPPRHRRFVPSWVPVPQPLPQPAVEPEQTPANIPRSKPRYTAPDPGEDVTVGVIIALPCEGQEGVWEGREEGEEGEVPQVVLGVIGVRTE